MASTTKSGSMTVLVEEYTGRLRRYLKTGGQEPDPQSFMDRYTRKSDKDKLRIQLNMATLLTMYGAEFGREGQKALQNKGFVEKSKQKFLNKIKQGGGAR